MVGPKAHRSFMGHLLGIPVKPTSSRLSLLSPVLFSPRDGTPATPCASLHHSLVRRNGSGSGGYNIFLEDSFSSAVDHGIVVPRCAGTLTAWQLQFVFREAPFTRPLLLNSESSKRIPSLFRWPRRPRFVADTRLSRVYISVYVMKLSLNCCNPSSATSRVVHYNKPTWCFASSRVVCLKH